MLKCSDYLFQKLCHNYETRALSDVYSPDRSPANRHLISLSIPYFTSFHRAFVVCNIYYLDFNLITAKPPLREIFSYIKIRDQISELKKYIKFFKIVQLYCTNF